MSSVFIVDNTDGTLTITMPPGSLNGPGSGTRDSDMRLYGMGALLWGEGVNENILRLYENFACPEKAGSPGIPQDEIDLGPGRGVTTPLEGQTWYNKTDQNLYFYNGTLWVKTSAVIVSTTQPAYSEPGDLWFDTTSGNPCGNSQLKIYNGSAWESVAVDYLSECGGTVTGNINMSGNSILDLSYPSASTDAANKQYVDDRETSILASLNAHAVNTGLHINANERIFLNNIDINVTPGIEGGIGGDIATLQGYNSDAALSTVPTDMKNRIRLNATDTMTVGQTIVLGKDPSAGTMQAATASWVETQIGALGAIGGDRIVKFWGTLAGAADDGDIHVDGTGKIFIKAQGTWEQVFPAQYTT